MAATAPSLTTVPPEAAPGSEALPGDPVTDAGHGQPGGAAAALPAVVKGCRVAMGVTMAFMLIIMI